MIIQQLSFHEAVEYVNFGCAFSLCHQSELSAQIDDVEPRSRNLKSVGPFWHNGSESALMQLGLARRIDIERSRSFQHDDGPVVKCNFHQAGRQIQTLARREARAEA